MSRPRVDKLSPKKSASKYFGYCKPRAYIKGYVCAYIIIKMKKKVLKNIISHRPDKNKQWAGFDPQAIFC